MYAFMEIHPAVLAITEIQRTCTIKHNTLMAYNNMVHVLVYQNHHHEPLLQQFKKHKSTCNMQFHELSYIFQQ